MLINLSLGGNALKNGLPVQLWGFGGNLEKT